MIMTTHTTTLHASAGALASAGHPTFLQRLLARYVASREVKARRLVAAHLDRMSDRQLADLGFTPVEMQYIRTSGCMPSTFWA